MKFIDIFCRFQSIFAGSLIVLLLFTASCSKEETVDMTYEVTYSVVSTGTVNLVTITLVDEFGFERPVVPPEDLTRTLRVRPGIKVGMRVTGNVLDGAITVRLQAVNPENTFDQEKPFSASGSVPKPFDISLEQDLR